VQFGLVQAFVGVGKLKTNTKKKLDTQNNFVNSAFLFYFTGEYPWILAKSNSYLEIPEPSSGCTTDRPFLSCSLSGDVARW
jgi:hypothetical protein